MTLFLESGASLAALLAAILLSLELGRRIGARHWRNDPAGADKGTAPIEGAVFGLMGLIIAFTFSGALSRYDSRRDLILQESNAIGTAWLRLDLLPAETRAAMQPDFRRYLDLRLSETRASASRASAEVAALQQKIWTRAVEAARRTPDPGITTQVLPAINAMFDCASARYVATQTHPPASVYLLLLVLALLCALLAGYGMSASKARSWLHILCFSGSLLMAIYVIIDVEFPRKGLIRVDRYDQVLIDLRESMR